MIASPTCSFSFFFNDTATTEIYTLSLHDALPISFFSCTRSRTGSRTSSSSRARIPRARWSDRKSTRLNSSHQIISYAVFCLKKKKNTAPDKTRDLPNLLPVYHRHLQQRAGSCQSS